MGQKEKLIAKIKTAKMADFEELDTLLKLLGFVRRITGSHHIYSNGTYVINIASHGKQVKKVYLENVKKLLEKLGY